MAAALGLREAKDIADRLQEDIQASAGFDIFGPDSPFDGKITFIKKLRDFSKQEEARHSIAVANFEVEEAKRRFEKAQEQLHQAIDRLTQVERYYTTGV